MVIFLIIKCIKKVILSAFMLYAFNMVAVHFNIVIPINLWTIGYVSLYDVPGIAILLILKSLGV